MKGPVMLSLTGGATSLRDSSPISDPKGWWALMKSHATLI